MRPVREETGEEEKMGGEAGWSEVECSEVEKRPERALAE
jgi:hypothetical protein